MVMILFSYKWCWDQNLGEVHKSLPFLMHVIIYSLSFCCRLQKIGREPINYWNDIVIRKFSIIDIKWNRKSFSFFMHLNIKLATFCCWIPKLGDDTKIVCDDIVIKWQFRIFSIIEMHSPPWVFLIVYASQYKVTILLLLDTKSGWRK